MEEAEFVKTMSKIVHSQGEEFRPFFEEAIDLIKEDDEYILDGRYLYSDNYNIDGEGFFLAPTNIEVNNYLLEVIYELLNNYPLDGIHYDYIRYHSINYGYNINGYKYLSNNKDGNDIEINLLNNLKRNAITDFVKRSKYIIKETLPNCIISAAVKPNIYNAKLIYGQEWDLWLSAGYLDWAVPMNYLVDDNDFIKKNGKQTPKNTL